MTVVDTPGAEPHPGELRLRRYRANELDSSASQEITRHTADCTQCRTKLRVLQEEENHFRKEISFERFAGGVERAERVPGRHPRRSRWAWGSLASVAAAAAVLLFAWPAHHPRSHGPNRTMGALSALARIAGKTGAQRSVLPNSETVLQAGDRIRLAYEATSTVQLLSLSVDDAGEITPLYPERSEMSLPVGPTRGAQYLPDSLELTGKGRERVFLFLANQSLRLDEAQRAVRGAYAKAGGDLGVLLAPVFEGRSDIQQFSWLFHKP
jgi:hypothetical protein